MPTTMYLSLLSTISLFVSHFHSSLATPLHVISTITLPNIIRLKPSTNTTDSSSPYLPNPENFPFRLNSSNFGPSNPYFKCTDDRRGMIHITEAQCKPTIDSVCNNGIVDCLLPRKFGGSNGIQTPISWHERGTSCEVVLVGQSREAEDYFAFDDVELAANFIMSRCMAQSYGGAMKVGNNKGFGIAVGGFREETSEQ